MQSLYFLSNFLNFLFTFIFCFCKFYYNVLNAPNHGCKHPESIEEHLKGAVSTLLRCIMTPHSQTPGCCKHLEGNEEHLKGVLVHYYGVQ